MVHVSCIKSVAIPRLKKMLFIFLYLKYSSNENVSILDKPVRFLVFVLLHISIFYTYHTITDTQKSRKEDNFAVTTCCLCSGKFVKKVESFNLYNLSDFNQYKVFQNFDHIYRECKSRKPVTKYTAFLTLFCFN